MDAREYGLPERVVCPFCERDDSELHSPFGTALSVATYWCRRCRTAFEWVKWNDRESTGSPPDDPRSSRSA
jgi:hypothetical protein